MATLRRIARALASVGLVLAPAGAAAAQEQLRLMEQDIKAALLYNFLRYTEWPAAHGPAVVCVFGGDPFDGRLDAMTGRTVNERAIEVRDVASVEEAGACTLLFVSSDERPRWPELQTYLADKAVLTVSDYDGFAGGGGMIEFTRTDSRIGMRINVDAVADADLTVQDRLLNLASPVHRDPAR